MMLGPSLHDKLFGRLLLYRYIGDFNCLEKLQAVAHIHNLLLSEHLCVYLSLAMKSTTLLAHTGLLGIAFAASPSLTEPLGHEWILPTPEDSRSPCPGLNVMANHGWLPRSGKDIDLAALQHAVKGAFNFAPDAFDDAFQIAVDFKLTTTGNSSTINLGDLDLHDAIEMDGSLSRNDFLLGDNTHFDPVVWVSTANRLGLYDCVKTEADKFVTVEKAAVARALRVQDAIRANPHFNASEAQQRGSPGTTGLFLATLWNETAGAAPKTWVRSFFGMFLSRLQLKLRRQR